MTHTQLREVLDRVQRVHCEAAEWCADAAEAPDERQSLLAEFFRQREEMLGRRLKSLETNELRPILETWVQVAPTQGVDGALAALRAARDEGSSTILKKCLELQNEIVGLFRQLAENLDAPTVREVLQDLAASEESAAKQLAVAEVTQRDA